VELLCTAAASYGSQGLVEKLQQLLDFLNLPGPVSKYLPAMNTIPLRHVGVLDLHIEAAAQKTVNLMLGSALYNKRACFCTVRLRQEASSHYDVVVYALSGGCLHAWLRGPTADFWSAGMNVKAVQLPVDPSSANGSMEAATMLCTPSQYGTNVKDETPLFERINTVLSNALSKVPLNSRTGALHSTTFRANFEYVGKRGRRPIRNWETVAGCVWAVWW
jgi:hypothetical protein